MSSKRTGRSRRMGQEPITENTLFYGDNLNVLREYVASECVDLIYLDPPFNSSRSYNVLFKNESGLESEAQIKAFEDTWHWSHAALETYYDLVQNAPNDVSKMIGALHEIIGENQMMAYLVMMTVRLRELHRVLKPTGSLYLHCDSSASHYLKIVLDTIFDPENFRNEIIWKRQSAHSDAKNQFADVSDTILFYSKSKEAKFKPQYGEHNPEYVAKFYRFDGNDGRGPYRLDNITSPNPRPNMMYEWMGFTWPQKGWRYQRETMQKLHDEGRIYYPRHKDGTLDTSKRPAVKRYLQEQEGSIIPNVWTDINPLHSSDAERLGYPTQKPLALLERIIGASSNPGDVVLDPFCVTSDTLIVTKTGVRPIKDVKIGDYVLTHTGRYRKVLRLYEREYDGTILNIERARSNVGIEITPNHPVLAVRSENCPYDLRRCLPRECHYHRNNRHLSCPNHKNEYQLEWIPAGELKSGDFVYYPIMETTPLERLLIPCNAHWNAIALPGELSITPDLMSWLGYFAAEGFVDENSVCFANYENAEHIADLGDRLFGLVGTITPRNYHSKRIRFASRTLSRWMEKTIGRGAANKHLPEWVFGTDATCRRALLSALLRSDGSFRQDKVNDASHSYRYASSSPTLAHQVMRLLQMEHIASGFKKVWPTSGGKVLQGRVIKVNHHSYQVEIWDATSVNRLLTFTNEAPTYEETAVRKPYDSYPFAGGQLFSIKKIEKERRITKVFNIEVEEDHSYVTATFTVHNCGCGTAVAAAEKLGRRWAGIDITHLSIALLKYRLEDMFSDIKYQVVGEPQDVEGAIQLANEDRYQFQWWALSLVRAKPLGGIEGSREGKKGSDRGIDGVKNFVDDHTGQRKTVIVQVKSGTNVNVSDIRDLRGTVEREKAAIGVFLTLYPPTEPMKKEAMSALFYQASFTAQKYPKIQILTIADLLRNGAQIQMPTEHGTFKQAPRVRDDAGAYQEELFGAN